MTNFLNISKSEFLAAFIGVLAVLLLAVLSTLLPYDMGYEKGYEKGYIQGRIDADEMWTHFQDCPDCPKDKPDNLRFNVTLRQKNDWSEVQPCYLLLNDSELNIFDTEFLKYAMRLKSLGQCIGCGGPMFQ